MMHIQPAGLNAECKPKVLDAGEGVFGKVKVIGASAPSMTIS